MSLSDIPSRIAAIQNAVLKQAALNAFNTAAGDVTALGYLDSVLNLSPL